MRATGPISAISSQNSSGTAATASSLRLARKSSWMRAAASPKPRRIIISLWKFLSRWPIAYSSLASYSPHLDTPPATAGSTRSARLMARRLGSRGRRFGPKPECPPQGQRVRRSDNARAHPAVDEHAPILEPAGEGGVDGVERGLLRHLGTR